VLAHQLDREPLGPEGRGSDRNRAKDEGFEVRRGIAIDDLVVAICGVRERLAGSGARLIGHGWAPSCIDARDGRIRGLG
jgi:hypothetical protein